ncbi:TetR family transcriptional regulator [Mycobacterium sp. CBMA 234]|nr:TetR family transcriptional regulator [Mycolicibacterium sp. CBMA 234]
MLAAAMQLLSERGTAGTTVDAVLARSNAPKGSVYYHFPGGRAEMVAESLRLSGDAIAAVIDEAATRGSRQALKQFGEFWQAGLQSSDFQYSCPVVSVAMGAPDDNDLQLSVRQIFTRWHTAITGALSRDGLDRSTAEGLATMVIASIEGAVILCRSQRSTTPLEQTVAQLDAHLANVMAANP